MDEWKDKYFQHMRVMGYSSETIQTQQWRLKPFFEYLQAQGVLTPEMVTSALLRNYQTFLFGQVNPKGEANHVSYRNVLLMGAKKFMRFLFQEEVLPEDPGEDVDYAIEPKRLPRNILTQSEMKRLLDAPDTTTALGYRDRTILEVFYSSGIRRSELLNLEVNDLDIDAELLRVNAGKGNKDRVVPLGKMAVRYLRHYLKTVRPLLVKKPTDYVFLSERGNRICKCMMGLRLKGYAKKAGIEKNLSVHTLRATCATHCLQGKKRREQMHPRHLMELLGHSSMESLNPYLSVSIADLKEAHGRCHPREKDKRVI
jgi:integrase/recombinase XerD